MDFSALITAVRQGQPEVSIPASWGQGRTLFGGLSVALVYEAMQAKITDERPLRSLSVSFIGPLQVEVPIRFEVELLRVGKSVSQVQGRAIQNGQTQVLVQGSFGFARESAVAVQAQPAPEIAEPAASRFADFIPGLMPAFLQHLGTCWTEGKLPGSNSRERFLGGWVGFRQPSDEPLGIAHLLALVDAWPPATLSYLPKRVPGSSLTWTIEFIQPLPSLTQAHWCQYRAEIEQAQDGYGHVSARLWSPQGELLAISRQVVVVFG